MRLTLPHIERGEPGNEATVGQDLSALRQTVEQEFNDPPPMQRAPHTCQLLSYNKMDTVH